MVIGQSVMISGTSSELYNGQTGIVTALEQHLDPPRYVVVLDRDGKKLKLKSENVSVVEEGEGDAPVWTLVKEGLNGI